MDGDQIRHLERGLVQKFALHGTRARLTFIKTKNKRPEPSALISLPEIETTILDIRANFDLELEEGRSAYAQQIAHLEDNLARECEQHLSSGLIRLAVQARAAMKKYGAICNSRPNYYLGGKNPSPAQIVDECELTAQTLSKRRSSA